MAKSRLHELAERGQSVWIDFLSREFVHGGELQRMIDEDAVTGITSNPSIFQSAIAKGRDYDEQMKALLARERRPDRDLLRARGRRRARRVRRAAAGLGGDGGADGYVSLEVDPTLANKTDETLRAGDRAARARRPAERPDQDPRHARGAARDRGLDRARRLDQHHADLLARALRGRRRGLHPRHRAARRGRRRPVEGRVGRVVLRLAHRHRDRQAPRSGSATRSCRASSASTTRSSPTSTSSRPSPGRAGRRSPRRERACSGRCGRRPRPRTRRTRTRSTSPS